MALAVTSWQGVTSFVPAASSASSSSKSSSAAVVQFGNLPPSASGNRRVLTAAQKSSSELPVCTSMQSFKDISAAQRLFFGTSSARDGRVNAKDEAPQAAGSSSAGTTSDEGVATIDIVRQVIADQLGVKIEELEPSSKFNELGADSLDTVEIMMGLEDRCGIAFEEDGAEAIRTVQDAADLIDAKKKK